MDYSLSGIGQIYNNNKDAIHAHIAGAGSQVANQNFQNVFGIGIATFVVIAIVVLGFWIFAIWYLYKNWATLPDWARVVGVIGVLPIPVPIGPIGTVIVVLIAKGSRKN